MRADGSVVFCCGSLSVVKFIANVRYFLTMYQPESLFHLVGANLCCRDDSDFSLCIKIIATQKTFNLRRWSWRTSQRVRDYVIMKRWAVDFQRVYMQGGQAIHYVDWDHAQIYVDQHPDPASLIRCFDSTSDDEITDTVRAVSQSWAQLDVDGIPLRDGKVKERRPVEGLSGDTIRLCLQHRRIFNLDRPEEMRCVHAGGTNLFCWSPSCGQPLPSNRDRDVPSNMLDMLFWDGY